MNAANRSIAMVLFPATLAVASSACLGADRPIDGTVEVKAHGTRQMPVWGRVFRQQGSIYLDAFPPPDTESAARSRMLALTEYLYRLQEK